MVFSLSHTETRSETNCRGPGQEGAVNLKVWLDLGVDRPPSVTNLPGRNGKAPVNWHSKVRHKGPPRICVIEKGNKLVVAGF